MNTIVETDWVTVSNKLLNIIEQTSNLKQSISDGEKDVLKELTSMTDHMTMLHQLALHEMLTCPTDVKNQLIICHENYPILHCHCEDYCCICEKNKKD